MPNKRKSKSKPNSRSKRRSKRRSKSNKRRRSGKYAGFKKTIGTIMDFASHSMQGEHSLINTGLR